MRHLVVCAATSGMMHALLRLWLSQEPLQLSLIGRNSTKLHILKEDLQIRQPSAVIHLHVCDFNDASAIEHTLAHIRQTAAIDIAIIAQGELSDQSLCQTNVHSTLKTININALSPVLFATVLSQIMLEQNQGHLVLISSVAGDRGRQSNYVYGSCKGMLNRFAEGLYHRFAQTPIYITLIKPGPTDTPMTQQLKAEGMRLASATLVATHILTAIEQKKFCCYVPSRWRWIMWIIRHLPYRIFNQLRI